MRGDRDVNFWSKEAERCGAVWSDEPALTLGPVARDLIKKARGENSNSTDPVNHPQHYLQFGVEVIDIIRHVLGPEGFRAYCIGNELKYRLRAGDKGDAAQDIAKAQKYREFREGK